MARAMLVICAMTAPRQVLPGVTYLFTRRCFQRAFLLRPSSLINQTIGFVLAVAAEKYGIQVHAFCVLSNHLHLVLTDPHARLPAFGQYFDSMVGRAVNASLGRWETFWAPGSYSAVTLATAEDTLAKAVYVLANPVAAGLVSSARRWPGLWSSPEVIASGSIEFERPRHFFREDGDLPRGARLELTAPPAFDDTATYCDHLRIELQAAEGRARAQAAESGKGFLGERRILKARPTAKPANREQHRRLKPRLACRDKWKRIEALGRLAAFVEAYRAALKSWRHGRLGVVFPAGTYLVRVTHGVACAAG
jgi:REP element-mobilizing transposase RayT